MGMAEEAKSVGYEKVSSSSSGDRVYRISMVVIAVVIVVALVFVIMSFVGDDAVDVGVGADECSNFSQAIQIVVCRVELMERLGEADMCEEDFGEVIFGYMFYGDFAPRQVDANDYCWLKASLVTGESYCDKIEDPEIGELCITELELSGVGA